MSTLSPLAASLHVALGGAIGAVLRYQTGRIMTGWLGAPAMTQFPWATLAVNAAGSLLMGLLWGWLAMRGGSDPASTDQLRLLLATGLLGGFTTFSAFSLEMIVMIERGQYLFASLYLVLSICLALSALMFGVTFMRLFQ